MRKSLAFLTWIVTVCFGLCASGSIVVQAQQPGWKTKKVVLDCPDGSMQQALEQVAAQAGISILAEGSPARKPFTGKAALSADKALSQIADACDYTWDVSKSGVVLLTKRFTDEHERPEVVPAEMRAVAHDILTAIQTVYDPPQERATISSHFRALFAALPPEQAGVGASRHGLLVANLPEPLRRQAIQAIYTEEFGGVYYNWRTFDQQMQASSQSRLTAVDRSDFDGKHLKAIVLADPGTPLNSSRWLWSKGDAENKVEEEVNVDAASLLPPPHGLLRADTVGAALDILHTRFHINVTLFPRMDERRVLLLLHQEDADRIVAALAELHNWRYQEKEQATHQKQKPRQPKQGAKLLPSPNAPDKTQSYFMYRRAFDAPRTIAEMGQAILKALPPDMARYLFTSPATLDGKPYIDIHKKFPMLPGVSDPTEFTYTKLTRHKDAALYRLRRSFAPGAFAASVPYGALTAQQKRDLVYYLFGYTVQQTSADIWALTHNPPDWLLDPLHVSIIQQGDSYGILRADGNIGFVVHESRSAPPAAPAKTP